MTKPTVQMGGVKLAAPSGVAEVLGADGKSYPVINASQDARILHALRFGRKLTPMAALRLFGCFRLAARVHALRKRGIKIQTRTITINGKKVAEYFL